MTTSQSQLADRFQQLHREDILVLPNAFDVASARLARQAGAPAVATTSAGISWSWGVADGEHLDLDLTLALVGRMVAALDVPVSVDIEGGFAEDLDGLARTMKGVVEAGAVGVNVEDATAEGLRTVEDQVDRLARIRTEAWSLGVDVFVNARTDVFLRQVGEPGSRLEETLRRAEAFLAAGASGIFVPGVTDPATIAELARRIPAPLNILVGPGSPTIRQLADLGVARASAGSSIAQAAYGLVRCAATELMQQGSYDSLATGADYALLNELMSSTAP